MKFEYCWQIMIDMLYNTLIPKSIHRFHNKIFFEIQFRDVFRLDYKQYNSAFIIKSNSKSIS